MVRFHSDVAWRNKKVHEATLPSFIISGVSAAFAGFNANDLHSTKCSSFIFLFRAHALTTIIQCPLDIATLDIAAALAIATSTAVTETSRYI